MAHEAVLGFTLFADHRNLPLVLPVIERLGGIHVVRRVENRLDAEQVGRVAHVRAHVRRNRRRRLEKARENLRVRPNDRIPVIDDIGIDRAVVRVDHDFHAVAHVVRAIVEPLGVRITRRRCVRIENPLQLAIGRDDHVGILVELEEWQREAGSQRYLAIVKDLALSSNVLRQEDVERSEPDREHRAPEDVANRNASAS